jgi:hypothetical protein
VVFFTQCSAAAWRAYFDLAGICEPPDSFTATKEKHISPAPPALLRAAVGR